MINSKKINLTIIIILAMILLASIVACNNSSNAQVEEPNIDNPSPTVIYDQEVIDTKYLKETISSATAIYYKSNNNGEFGDDNQVFEYTTLPSIFSEVEYIESNGLQYIDTKVPYSENLSFELKFSDYVTSAKSGGIFGTDGLALSLYRNKKQELTWSVNDARNYTYTSFSPYKEYVVKCSNNQLLVNNTKTNFAASTGIKGNGNISIFKNQYGYGSLKLYYFKIFDGNTLIRDFVPCYNNLDSTVGLYDLVSESFYSNSYGSNFGGSSIVDQTVELPNEYQQIEYIETNGKQYIDTGIYFDFNTDSFEITVQSTNTTQNGMIINDCSDNKGYLFFLYHYSEGGIIGVFANENTSNQILFPSRLSSNNLEKHTYIYKDKYLYVDGNSTSNQSERTFADFPGEVRLFASNRTTAVSYGYYGKCYGCKFMKSGELVRDFIPVICNINGQIGLYDIIENKFYSSSTSTSLIAGDRIYNLSEPLDFTKTEYIECNGTQYINTNYIPTSNTSIEITYSVNSFSDNTTFIFGSAGDNCMDRAFELYPWNDNLTANINDQILQIPNANPSTIASAIFSQGNIYYKEGNSSYKLVTSNNTITNSPVELYLFALNRNGNILPSSQCRIYSFKIYEGTTLVKYFVPYLRNVDCKPGLYELINGVFYVNNGTGEFITNNIVTADANNNLSTALPEEYESIPYLQSTGTQWINTNVQLAQSTFIDADIMFDSAFAYNMMFGVWSGLSLSLLSKNQACVSGGGAETKNIGVDISTNVKYNIKLGLGSYIQNNKYYSFGKAQNIPSTCDFMLFAASSTTYQEHVPYNWSTKYSAGKIYSFKIYENNTLIRYFIPALRKSDLKPGLYDLIGNVFYTNQGTDEFKYALNSESYKNINQDNLLASYTFNGDGNDSSGNQHSSLTYNKTTGKVSTYANNLTNTTTSIPINELNGKVADYSISCWIKIGAGSSTNYQNVFALGVKNAQGSNTQRLELYSPSITNPKLLFIVNKGYSKDEVTASKISISYDTWIHLAYVINSQSVITYVNGVKKAEYSYPYSEHEASTLTGLLYFGGTKINCSYNDLRIFDDCLSSSEVKQLASESKLDDPVEDPAEYEFLSSIDILNNPVNLGVTGDAKYTFDIKYHITGSKQLMGYDQFNNNNWGVSQDGYYISGDQIWDKAGNRDIFIDEYINGVTNKYLNGTLLYSTQYNSLNEYTLGNASLTYQAMCSYTLFSLSIEKENNIIINYIPAKRISDGSTGLYDIINDKYILLNESYPNFNYGDIVGHNFDDGTIVTPVSEKQDGEIVYTCKICGKQITKKVESYSYSVTFEYDEGIEHIKVYNGYDLSTFEISNVAYTRNNATNNFSKENGIVYFEIVFKEGYSIDKIKTQGALCNSGANNIYCASMITSNTIFKIKSKQE